MSVFSRGLFRGLTAGAAGTTVLNAVTYLDMALTGRSASSAPTDTVMALADKVGVDLPTKGSRDEAYGALSGLGTGVGIGVVAGLVRSSGIRLPYLAETAVIGFGAMAATDGPMAVLDVSDMTTWSSTDWVRDVVPHLAYGAAVAAALRTSEDEDEDTPRQPAKPGRVLAKSLAIGIATGARSSIGLVPPALVGGALPAVVSAGLVGTELVMDKKPDTPSRIGGPTILRVGSAAAGAATLARHEDTGILPAVAAAGLGAMAGSILGATWRQFSSEQGWDDWQAAVVEDVVALALTVFAFKG